MADEPINTAAPTNTGAPAGTPAGEPTGATTDTSNVVTETNTVDTQSSGEGQTIQGDQTSEQGPQDLSEAFGMVSEKERERLADTLPKTNGDAETGNAQAGDNQTERKESTQMDNTAGAGQSNQNNNMQAGQDGQLQSQINQQSGSLDNSQQAYSYEQYGQLVTAEIKNRAQADAAKELSDKNIKQLSLQDLQVADESNQRIYWNNPHNPNEPFTTMKEASDFVETYNKQVNIEYNKLVNQKAQQYKQSVEPHMRLEAFRPVYAAMSPAEQNVCSMLVEQYAVRNQAGQPIGFSCDLNAAAKQAKAIVAAIQPTPQQIHDATQQVQKQSNVDISTPALDANTANASPQPEGMKVDDIKDYSDAFKYMNEQEDQKKGQNNG